MIQVEHLTKCYGDVTAVDDLSFEIEGGHVYGFWSKRRRKIHHHEHHDRMSVSHKGKRKD